MKKESIISLYNEYVMATYTRMPLVLAKGKGIRVWDEKGRIYLDFFPGWAVSGLGHCHPKVVKAIKKQADKILHVSNNYYNELQGRLAQRIIASSFPGKVFFCNSGAEAIEGAIKLARMYGGPSRYEVITMLNSFHGRTLAAIAATGQEKVKKGFEPLPEGFKHIPFNDISAFEEAITPNTAAVIIEPIQGEGGINVAGRDYIKRMRDICNTRDILLIFDEVQTGMGRTGELFCFKHYGVEPDVMTLAKSLGGGLPIGALVVKEKISGTLKSGSHASTFGGSPIVCAAALAAFDAIEKEGLIENARAMGSYLVGRLKKLAKRRKAITDIKGMGLMLGVVLGVDGKVVYERCLEKGLLINCTQGNVLRIMPPLLVRKKDIDKAISILDGVLKEI